MVDIDAIADQLKIDEGLRLKPFLWLCSAIGGVLALLGVFWDQLFGGGPS